MCFVENINVQNQTISTGEFLLKTVYEKEEWEDAPEPMVEVPDIRRVDGIQYAE